MNITLNQDTKPYQQTRNRINVLVGVFSKFIIKNHQPSEHESQEICQQWKTIEAKKQQTSNIPSMSPSQNIGLLRGNSYSTNPKPLSLNKKEQNKTWTQKRIENGHQFESPKSAQKLNAMNVHAQNKNVIKTKARDTIRMSLFNIHRHNKQVFNM